MLLKLYRIADLRHRQERDGTIFQTTHERDDKNGTTIVLVIPFITSFLFMPNFHCVYVFVVIHKISKIANFKRNFLENDNDSEFTVKTKNAPFFMDCLNINKNWQLFPARNGPLKQKGYKHDVIGRTKIGC